MKKYFLKRKNEEDAGNDFYRYMLYAICILMFSLVLISKYNFEKSNAEFEKKWNENSTKVVGTYYENESK